MIAPEPKQKIENSISASAFQKIAALAQTEAGIVLPTSKQSMVRSRLTKRLRALNLYDFETYLNVLQNEGNPDEMKQFISALTTNVSHFFRENHHFETLKEKILPGLLSKLQNGQKVRIWSAGCSNGQEPYSIAMTLLEFDNTIGTRDIKILATDIDPEVLTHAMAGKYSGALTSGLEESVIEKYFFKERKTGEEYLYINDDVKSLVSFRQLNLHAEWPMSGEFDVIFCRNVVIYFDDSTQAKLYKRFSNSMTEDGWLLLGHSERLNDESVELFKNAGVTTYRPTTKHRNMLSKHKMESAKWR
jgi:chemotaxis protein methyltransferase CheR